MSHFSASEIQTLSETQVRAAILVKMDFVSGAKYVWNGKTELLIGGNTYIPLHGLGRFDGLTFTREPVSQRFTVSIEGLPAKTTTTPGSDLNVLALALSETDEVEGKTITVSYQFFGEDWQPVGSPVGLALGFMRKPRVDLSSIDGEDGPIQTIKIGCENMFYNRSLPPLGRYTDRDQQARYSGDLICQFQPDLRIKKWTYPSY